MITEADNVPGWAGRLETHEADATILVQRPLSWRPRKADVLVQV